MEELQKHTEVLTFLKNAAKKNGVEESSITHVQTNAKGEGYLGKIWMITLRDDATNTSSNLVIKSALTGDKVRKTAPIRLSFENEVYFYSEVLPVYKNLSPNFIFAPECFDVTLTDTAEMLALENLRVSGFEVFDKHTVLDHDHVKLIFDTYGKFHALSFALKQNHLEKYREITGHAHNIYKTFLDVGLDKVFDNAADLIKKSFVPGKDDEIMEKFRKYEGNMSNIFIESVGESKFNTILHGDCWSNNMMFKYQKIDSEKKVTDMRFLDFQLIKSGSPACDLSYCFYSGGSKPVFDRLEEYLTSYYQNFVSFLKQLGGDPEKAFSYEDLKEEWRKFSVFGFMMGLGIWQMKFTPTEEIKDLVDMAESPDGLKAVFDEEAYVIRIREIMDSMLQVNAL